MDMTTGEGLQGHVEATQEASELLARVREEGFESGVTAALNTDSDERVTIGMLRIGAGTMGSLAESIDDADAQVMLAGFSADLTALADVKSAALTPAMRTVECAICQLTAQTEAEVVCTGNETVGVHAAEPMVTPPTP